MFYMCPHIIIKMSILPRLLAWDTGRYVLVFLVYRKLENSTQHSNYLNESRDVVWDGIKHDILIRNLSVANR